MFIHPAAAHLKGKPCQWVFLGARNHREKAQGHGQTTHSNHVTPLTGISVTRFWAESILPSPAAYAGVHVNRAGISARSRQKDKMRLVNFSPIRSGVLLR